MKHLPLLALPFLFACASSRHLALEDAGHTCDRSSACSGPCHADVSCTPDGRCLVKCAGPNGQPCEIELDCSGSTCKVVRCVGTDCNGANVCVEAKAD